MIDSEAYERDGFLILRGLLRGDRLASAREAADALVARARAIPATAASTRLDLLDARIGPALDLLDAIGRDEVVDASEALAGGALVANGYSLNVDTPSMRWHRDEEFLPRERRWDVARWRDARPFSQVQWNLALVDDERLRVVPGSHRGETTPERARVLARGDASYVADLPGDVRVPLRAGDGVIYNSNLLHAVLAPPEQPLRRTLHWFWVRDGEADPYGTPRPDLSPWRGRLPARLAAMGWRAATDPEASPYRQATG